MNIAFDMFFARTEARRRGIGRYSHNLIHSMITSETEHSYFYFYPDLTKGLAALKDQLQQFLHRNRIDVYHIMSPFYLFHLAPSQFEKYRHMTFERSWFGSVRVAITLYDVIPLVYEEQFLNDYIRPAYWAAIELIRSCDAIFAISETTKVDAARLADIDPDKITVIMAGLDPRFEAAASERKQGTSVQYGIKRPYVMCTGGTDPRKNTIALIDAFLSANKLLRKSYQLVVACAMSEVEKQELRSRAASSGDEEAVILTGFVSDSELIELYKGATLFAFPSMYEGFGLPVLEAMACGTPVLTSNNSSLKEISGEAACQVDPTSMKDIAEKMVLLLSQPDLLKRMAQRGLKQAAKFTWSKSSRLVFDTYEGIVRRRLAIVAPAATPYASPVGLLPYAAAYLVNDFDVDVYTFGEGDSVVTSGPEDGGAIQSYDFSQFAKLARSYDYIIYEFGDDERYLPIVPTMLEKPGIVVVSSINLHGLSIRTTLERNRLDAYYKVLESEFGTHAHLKLDGLLSGRLKPSEVKLNRHYLGGARAVVVYSSAQSKALIDQGYSSVIAAPVPVPEQRGTKAGREERFLFASFGPHATAAELHPMLTAFKQLVSAIGNRPVLLRIVGPYGDGERKQLMERAISLGIGDRVDIAEAPANEQEADSLWRETTVALQLEKASEGRLSYASYLSLSYGIPLIVREQTLDLAPTGQRLVAYRIRDDANNETLILNAMLSLYRNESLREELSREGLEYARATLTPAAFADALRQAMVRMGNAAKERSVLWQFSMTPSGVPRINPIQTN